MEAHAMQVSMVLASAIDAATVGVITLGVLGASVKAWQLLFRLRRSLDDAMAEIRLSIGRWLALGLELALAADIVRTVMVPTWDRLRSWPPSLLCGQS